MNLLRFLKRYQNVKSSIQVEKPGGEVDIVFHTDADFAGREDRLSTVGSFGWINGNLFYADCSVVKQMLTSSAETESHGCFKACKVGVYARNWLSEVLGIKYIRLPMYVFNDNQAAIQILSTRSNSSRSKHFDVRLRYVTMLVEQGQIIVAWIERGELAADMLTHALSRPHFEKAGLEEMKNIANASSNQGA